MPCYKPLDGYASAYVNPTGKTRIVFNPAKAANPREIIPIPCGRCIGCRLETAKEWALRCTHEAQLHKHNQFVTLTYSPEHMPENAGLKHSDVQKFMKRLRKGLKQKIRYFMCGEYGNICVKHGGWIDEPVDNKPQCKVCRTGRPHYHLVMFNLHLPDRYLWYVRDGYRYYRSPTIEKYWHLGSSEVSDVSFQSAGYVARYSLKKQTGKRKKQTYGIIKDGVITEEQIPQPYTRMSLRPGIGYDWYQKYKSDLFPHDYAVTPDGRQMAVPTYYRNLLKEEDPELAEQLREARLEKAKANPDNTEARLEARNTCKEAQASRLKRNL